MGDNVKVWKASKEAKAAIEASGNSIVIRGNEKNFIAVEQSGVTLAGAVNYMTTSENIRQGGLFIQMNDFVRMIPSTIVTPIPPQIPFPPIAIMVAVALVLPTLIALKS